tara:strand:+ start:286 stop:870 length:585 start_codon:yes stop_codon:yes gene_type:complete
MNALSTTIQEMTSSANVSGLAGNLFGKRKMQKRVKPGTLIASEDKKQGVSRCVQVKGKSPVPKTSKGNPHPYQGKCVGESMKEKELKEGVLDATDDDGWVAKEQLYKTAKYAIELHQMINDSDEVEPWLQVKITEAADRLSSVKHYMEYLHASIGQEELPQMSGSAMIEPEVESIDNELAQINSIRMNPEGPPK